VTISTDRISLDAVLSADRSVLQHVAQRTSGGGVFVYPTETIYGIGGRADSEAVEARIRSVKGRSKLTPFILLASDLGCFSSYAISFPPIARVLAQNFWPGNLTLILPWKNHEEGAGLRISDHPFIAALCGEIGMPIFSTSANMSEQVYRNDPDEIFRTFDGRVDFFIDAGKLAESKPSTIVTIRADDSFEVLREGAISQDSILNALH
jgi:L-threonylcarbamoyladenylate synthase